MLCVLDSYAFINLCFINLMILCFPYYCFALVSKTLGLIWRVRSYVTTQNAVSLYILFSNYVESISIFSFKTEVLYNIWIERKQFIL